MVICCVGSLIYLGGGAGVLRCSRARREPPGRRAPGDDRSECDGVHRRVTDCHLRRPELALPHALRPETERLPVSRAGLHHRRAAQEEEDRVAAAQPAQLLQLFALLRTLDGRLYCNILSPSFYPHFQVMYGQRTNQNNSMRSLRYKRIKWFKMWAWE